MTQAARSGPHDGMDNGPPLSRLVCKPQAAASRSCRLTGIPVNRASDGGTTPTHMLFIELKDGPTTGPARPGGTSHSSPDAPPAHHAIGPS